MNGRFSGLLVPMLTRFNADMSIDTDRSVEYCQSLLDRGASGVALFGTTGEANSMSARERRDLLTATRAGGVSGDRLMVGIGACSIIEAVESFRHAAELDVAATLMLPPFYYKSAAATDDGLFDFTEQVIRRTEGAKTKIYLYHIPQIAQVGWSIDLIRRLIDAFPDRIVGLKDSTPDWEHTQRLIATFPDLDILAGSELNILKSLRAGGRGCITATGNINLTCIQSLCDASESDHADALQIMARDIRLAVQNLGVPIAIMKAFIALKTGDENWSRVRPPIRPVSMEIASQLDQQLVAMGFEYDGM